MKICRIFLVIAVAAPLLLTNCVVSKKDYLLKEEEADNCSRDLKMQVGENLALREELSSCQEDLAASGTRVNELTGSLARVSSERDGLSGQLTTQQAVNQELKTHNDRLGSILEKKEINSKALIQETMEINKGLQGTNAQLREKLATNEAESRRMKTDLAAVEFRLGELERQKEAELEKLKATYDELVGSLKGEIEAGEVEIRRMKDRLSVNLVEKILFDSGKADLKSSGIEVMKKVGTQLARIEGKRIQIEGHTDDVPIGGRLKEKFPTNWELAASRALAVVHFLQDEVGISPEKLSGAGYGEYQPAESNDTAEGKAANRRIEIVLLPPYESMSEAQESTTTAE
ncbi:MAG: OmpA family protein [bacterium]|nr:OmpA family protein [bacterium]